MDNVRKRDRIKYFSLFSGIGGFELALKEIGECVGFSEIDKNAIDIYSKHFPTHKNYGDITKIIPGKLPTFDLLVGGFPCQAFSIAGKRQGFKEARGTLFFDIAKILSEKRPRYLVLENVKGLLTHESGKTFQTILRILAELGYRVEWSIFNSLNFGVPQLRQRIYITGTFREEGERVVFGEGKNKETSILLDCWERFRNTNYNWKEIGRVSSEIIRTDAGFS